MRCSECPFYGVRNAYDPEGPHCLVNDRWSDGADIDLPCLEEDKEEAEK